MCEAEWAVVAVWPSPKSHNQAVGDPVEVPVKATSITVTSLPPLVGAADMFTVGLTHLVVVDVVVVDVVVVDVVVVDVVVVDVVVVDVVVVMNSATSGLSTGAVAEAVSESSPPRSSQ